jgi:hypothetical protein
VSCYAVWHFFEHEGISFKNKPVRERAGDRLEVARWRAQWKKYQGRLDRLRLVFIDETWAKTNITRSHGRSPRGRGLVAKILQGRWRRLTFLAEFAPRLHRCSLCHRRADQRRKLLAYVEQVLVPTVNPGDIVIIVDLGSHKGKAVRRAIQAAGAKLFFQPPYSPVSTRSNKRLPSSKACCAKLQNEPSKQPNAPTIS